MSSIKNPNSKFNLINERVKYGTDGGINVDSGALYVNAINGRVGINTTSPSTNLDISGTIRTNSIISSSGNFDISGYYEVNGVPINNSFYPALNTSSFGVKAVSTWQERTTLSKTYNSICWSPERNLFVAVANGDVCDNVMVSPNGVNWTSYTTSDASSAWVSVCYSKELGIFCASNNTTTTTRKFMTSLDGINWTLIDAPNRNWNSVIWAPELNLFVAIASSGTNDRVITSPDGINWTLRTTPVDNNWIGVCWSKELRLLVAVSFTGSGNRIMTSPDGINWTIRRSPADNQWISVCWSSELSLFAAVSQTGSNCVMTSPDGINWTAINVGSDTYRSIVWSPELRLFCAVSSGSSATRVLTSFDGITWTLRNAVGSRNWRSVAWSPELGIFCAVANSGTNRAMISSLTGRPPTSFNVFDSSFNNINQLGLWSFQSFGRGAPVTKTNPAGNAFTVQPGENWIIINNAATTTVTLPTASAWPGREIMMKNLSTTQSVISNANNVVPLGSDVSGNAIFPAAAGVVKFANLVSDGSSWIIMKAN